MNGSFLTTVKHCQCVAWVRQSALGEFILLRLAVPSITENETKVSFFNGDLYENFKLNLPGLYFLVLSLSYVSFISMGVLNFIVS